MCCGDNDGKDPHHTSSYKSSKIFSTFGQIPMQIVVNMIPQLAPTNDESKISSYEIPEGFSISTNVVSEEAWDEIRMYLGLTTFPHPFDGREGDNDNIVASIELDGNGDQKDGGMQGKIANPSTEIPWESTPFPQNRPVVQFGFRYDYEKDIVVPPPEDNTDQICDETAVPKIPEVFQRLLLRPYQESIGTRLKNVAFTQCIVNVYRPSTAECTSSIPWHFDDPQFGPEILVFTFGETRPLNMRLKHESNDNDYKERIDNCENDDNYSYFTAHPAHRSSYVLSGPARHKWQHSVPSGSSWRVSITFRTLNS